MRKKSNSYHKVPEMLRNWVPDPSKAGTENKTLVESFYKKFLGPYVSSSIIHSQKTYFLKPLEKRDLIFENVEQKMKYVLHHKV